MPQVQKIKEIGTLGSGSLAKLCLYAKQVSSEVPLTVCHGKIGCKQKATIQWDEVSGKLIKPCYTREPWDISRAS